MAARRPFDADRLPGARAREGHRLRRGLRRAGHAPRLRLRRLDVVGEGIRPGVHRLGEGQRQRHPARRRDLRGGLEQRHDDPRRRLPARRAGHHRAADRLSAVQGARRRRVGPRAQPLHARSRRRHHPPHGALRPLERTRDPLARPGGGAARGGDQAVGRAARRPAAAHGRPRHAARVAPRAVVERRVELPLGPHRLSRPGAPRRPENAHLSELLVLRPRVLRGADPRRRQAEDRSVRLQEQDRLRRRDGGRALRRVRDAVRARQDAGHPGARRRRRRSADGPVHVAGLDGRPGGDGPRRGAGHRRGRDGRARVVGDGHRRRAARALRVGGDAPVRRAATG